MFGGNPLKTSGEQVEKLTCSSEKGDTNTKTKRKERGRDIDGEKDGGKQQWQHITMVCTLQ